MKNLKLMFLPVLLVILVSGLALSSCQNPVIPGFSSNNDVISYKEFYLNADNVSLETSIRGTIFVKGDMEKPGDRRVLINAWVEIDENDWGGVGIGIPQGWEITSITSDYPQGNPKPESYIRTMQTASDESFVKFIYIGVTKYGSPEIQGGKGGIVIELSPETSDEALPDTFSITIGVGSKYDYILGPVHEIYEVLLNTDYHNVSPYTIHPSPGYYLTDNDLKDSAVALKDVRAEIAAAERDYNSPNQPGTEVKKGDSILVITGHVQNLDKEKFEIAMWAEGYSNLGKTVAWTLDAAHIIGQIGMRLEYKETGEFTLHLSLPEGLKTVRIFGTNYLVTPP